MYESSQLTLYSASQDPWRLLCLVRRVSLAEYILILRVYSHCWLFLSINFNHEINKEKDQYTNNT